MWPVLQDVVELEKAAAGVIEHAVQHDANVPGMGLADQFPQSGVAAQQRIDFLVIVRVVAMIAGRLEDRVQIDRVDAEVGQVVQVLGDAQ